MTNPIEEFFEEYGEKNAAGEGFRAPVMKALHGMGSGALQGAGVMGAATAVGAAGLAVSKIYAAATKSRDFRNMLSYNPDLQEHHDRDPRMFNQMFTSLRTMNPGFSADPIVAGSYMRRMTENPLNAGGIAVESVSSRDKMPSMFGGAVERGMGAVGSKRE